MPVKPAFFGFDDITTHAWMLLDHVRLDAYERAIREVVRPGDVVVDVGTGTGILALLAARAGARRVYALEHGAVAELAERIVAHNGLSDVVQVIRGDARDATFEEPPDVLVSETLGSFGLDEDISALLRVLVRRCRPHVRMIPERLRLFVAPAEQPRLADELRSFDSIGGVDLSIVRRRVAQRPTRHSIEAAQLLATPVCVADLDLRHDAPPRDFSASFRATRAGRLDLLAGWFEADLSPSVRLSTSPTEPDTHWHQLCFPLDPRLDVAEGDALEADIDPRVTGPGALWRWHVRLGETERSGDVLDSSGGSLQDFALQLGLGLTGNDQPDLPSDWDVWVTLLGGEPRQDPSRVHLDPLELQAMTGRLLARFPERYADESDALEEVRRRLAQLATSR